MVRIRISGDIATVAIKGPRTGITRPEFEYEVPISDAERMFSTICGNDTLEKERFFVEDAGATWLVDVYGGILNGVLRRYCRDRTQARDPGADPSELGWQGSN